MVYFTYLVPNGCCGLVPVTVQEVAGQIFIARRIIAGLCINYNIVPHFFTAAEVNGVQALAMVKRIHSDFCNGCRNINFLQGHAIREHRAFNAGKPSGSAIFRRTVHFENAAYSIRDTVLGS